MTRSGGREHEVPSEGEQEPRRLQVGFVRRPHGLQGEVSVEPRTDFPERFRSGTGLTWQRGSETRAVRVASARPHGTRVLLSFEGIRDREGARLLSGGELSVAEGEVFPTPSGFYYAHEIEGWVCIDSLGRRLGLACGLENTPAGPLLTVCPEVGRQVLVPFVDGIVVEVNRDLRRIVLDPPEGLMELSFHE